MAVATKPRRKTAALLCKVLGHVIGAKIDDPFVALAECKRCGRGIVLPDHPSVDKFRGAVASERQRGT